MLRVGDFPLHTHQLAIIEEGEPDGLEVKADLVLSGRLGGEGKAAPRAVLTGQQILEETASVSTEKLTRNLLLGEEHWGYPRF